MRRSLRFFRSMRFGMILLVLVMALSVVGSLIPQKEQAMTYVRAYGAEKATLLMALGWNDLFHTWYFLALEGLLCINLLLCSILRFPRTVHAGEQLMKTAEDSSTETPCDSAQLQRMKEFLLSHGFRKRNAATGEVYTRHFLGFYGSFLTHLSILWVLLFGSLVLMTPQTEDLTVMPGESLVLSDGTRILCESFHIEDGQGKLDYASTLHAISADGKQEKIQEIRVNEPMRFGNYKVYQQTYGTAGRVRIVNHATETEDTLFLTESCFLSIDGQNGVYFEALYPGFVQDDDGNYTLVTNTSGSYPDPVYRIQTIAEGMSTSVLAFPDETLSLGEIDFTFLLPAEYPGLRIKHVSSVLYGALYFGFGLMIAALYLCFFMVPAAVSVREDGYSVVSPKEVQEIREALTIAGKEEEP
ncbi:MAG: cytochrome c biogenesis protein ResB [Clostridia bacterium]|nr:cytochrome c biogenesis protein ResB [Clostridia bacterium]